MEAIINSPIGNLLLVEEDNQLVEVVFTDKDIIPMPVSELLTLYKLRFIKI